MAVNLSSPLRDACKAFQYTSPGARKHHGVQKKRAKLQSDRAAEHETVKDSLKNELWGKEQVSKTFIHKQLNSIARELHEASLSNRNQGLQGLIAVYLAGLACFFVKKD